MWMCVDAPHPHNNYYLCAFVSKSISSFMRKRCLNCSFHHGYGISWRKRTLMWIFHILAYGTRSQGTYLSGLRPSELFFLQGFQVKSLVGLVGSSSLGHFTQKVFCWSSCVTCFFRSTYLHSYQYLLWALLIITADLMRSLSSNSEWEKKNPCSSIKNASGLRQPQ